MAGWLKMEDHSLGNRILVQQKNCTMNCTVDAFQKVHSGNILFCNSRMELTLANLKRVLQTVHNKK
jgi:hypothetical protein